MPKRLKSTALDNKLNTWNIDINNTVDHKAGIFN